MHTCYRNKIFASLMLSRPLVPRWWNEYDECKKWNMFYNMTICICSNSFRGEKRNPHRKTQTLKETGKRFNDDAAWTLHEFEKRKRIVESKKNYANWCTLEVLKRCEQAIIAHWCQQKQIKLSKNKKTNILKYDSVSTKQIWLCMLFSSSFVPLL